MLLLMITTVLQAQTYSGGDGSKDLPYLISSKADMAALATAVNGGNQYTGKYFLLTTDLTGITSVIGNGTYQFRGIFDGDENSIEINITTSNASCSGVFGEIYDATVKNLIVKGQITALGLYSGGVCGYAYNSSIINCHSSVNISTNSQWTGGICGQVSSSNCTITNCSNKGNISISNYIAGGICGQAGNGVSITDCYNTGNISANGGSGGSAYAGGICARGGTTTLTNSVEIVNCYNTGNISSASSGSYANYSGGICGDYSKKVFNCFTANSTIDCTGSGTKLAGRILGGNGTVTNCYALSSILVNDVAINSTNANSKDGKDVDDIAPFQSQEWIENNIQWDFDDVWKMSDVNSIFNGLPIFKSQEDIPTGNVGVISVQTDAISIYPNPANQYLYINSDISIKGVELYNVTGNLVLNKTNDVNNINVISLIDGIYYLQIHTDNKTIVKKVVIKK